MSWDPKLHPRNPEGTSEGGEFRSTQSWVHKLLGKTDRTGRVHGGDVSEELDYAAARARGRRESHLTDGVLKHIIEQQGFDGPPRVVSADEMDRAVADGWTPMTRHVGEERNGAEYAEQYRTGPMWVGLGGYANGVYFMPQWRADSAEGYGDGQIHVALAPDARTINIKDLYERMKADGLAQWDRNQDTNSDRTEALTDAGRYAAAKGYDAIYVPSVPGSPEAESVLEWIVLNRTATIVQEA